MQPKFVFDTSAFINSWRYHYRLPVFEGVWTALGYALAREQIVAPDEVLREVKRKAGGELHDWLAPFPDAFRPPQESWQPHMETVRQHAPHWFSGTADRDAADPFVVAMALDLALPVVTYEGIAFSGDPARVRTYKRSMPHISKLVGVPTLLMVDVLEELGVVLA